MSISASEEESCALMLTRLAHQGCSLSLSKSIPSCPESVPRDLIASDPTEHSKLYQRILNRKLISQSFHTDSDLTASLLSTFDKDVLSNPLARKQLLSLRPETQEKYLYQIRRYIRHCAANKTPHFFVTKELSLGLIEAELEIRGEISSNTVKSIRSPLNKLCNMNRIVYGDKQALDPLHELVDEIFREYLFKDNKDMECSESCQKRRRIKTGKPPGKDRKVASPHEVSLLAKFNREIVESPKTQSIVFNLTGSTLRAYLVDIKRYVKYCARCGNHDFSLSRDTVDGFLRFDVMAQSNPSTTKLKSVRSSLLKLLQLLSLAHGVVYDDSYIVDIINDLIERKEVVAETLGVCIGHESVAEPVKTTLTGTLLLATPSGHSDVSDEGVSDAPSGRKRSIEEFDHTVPRLAMNGDITSVTQLLEEWTLVVKRNQQWGLKWIQTATDKERYICRKCIIELVEELVSGSAASGFNLQHRNAARVLDAYITHQQLTLEAFASSLHTRRQSVKAKLSEFTAMNALVATN